MTSTCHATHLLLKHSGSRNPVSRRTNGDVTMSKANNPACVDLGTMFSLNTQSLQESGV